MTGIVAHADQAKVNVNFWLTPDEANLDPTNGRLVTKFTLNLNPQDLTLT